MAIPFQKQKARLGKYNPRNIMFTDFSEGLYLLDTPRDINEQLGSLALKGGRNVFAEKGALVPQYGYYPLTELNELSLDEKIIAVTKDDKSSSSFFIVTNFGNVYLYTAFQGLKRYKTTIEPTDEEILAARSNNNMIMYYSGGGYLFGDYYDEADLVTIDSGCTTNNYGSYITATVPIDSKIYYWNGKKVFIPSSYSSTKKDGQKVITSNGVYTITNMTNGEGVVYKEYPYKELPKNEGIYIRGYISLNQAKQVVDLGNDTTISCVPVEHVGQKKQVVENTVLKYECYNVYGGNGFESLGLGGLTRIYVSPGSSSARYEDGSLVVTTIGINDALDNRTVFNIPAGTRISLSDGKASIVPISGIGTGIFWKQASRDPSGDIYETVSTEEYVPGDKYYTYKMQFKIKDSNGLIKTVTTTKEYNAGFYEWQLQIGIDWGSVGITIFKPNSRNGEYVGRVDDFGLLNTNLSSPKGVKISVKDRDTFVNQAVEDSIILTMIPDPDNTSEISTVIDITEKTYLPTDFIYTPEEEDMEQTVLIPTLLEVCANRLCIVNYDGFIYYTGVGITNVRGELKLDELAGAGYFGGFYNDNSKVLSLDDYMAGVLITKQNGLYYLTIADTYSSSSVTTDAQSGLNIKKVAEIGQQYKTDHIIVKEQVYAYDSNSDAIVLACTSNMYGAVVPGRVLIDAEFLNAQNFGISSSKRCLTFNKDAQVFILYYGDDLKHGILLNATGNLFPREMDRPMLLFQGFNQGVIGITKNNIIVQDYHKNTIIPDVVPVADFEAIGLKDHRCICASIAEVSELNGIEYDFLTTNTLTSFQHIKPYTNFGIDKLEIPPMIYSDALRQYDSYGVLPDEESIPPIDLAKIKGLNKWADKKSNSTKIYAPMSGRAGINICIQFPANVAFCLAGIRLNDFSQGD